MPDRLTTRLDLSRRNILEPGLWIIALPETLSEAAREQLGERLEILPDGFRIRPLPGETMLTPDNLGPKLDSTLIATVGPFELRVVIIPSRHDTIEVVDTLNDGIPPPDPDLASYQGSEAHGPHLPRPRPDDHYRNK